MKFPAFQIVGRAAWVLCLLLLCLPSSGSCQEAPIRFQVSTDSLSHHRLQIEASIPPTAFSGPEREFAMAVWTPGSYKVRDYPRFLGPVTLAHPTAQLEKTSKNRWRVTGLDPEETLILNYEVYGHELTVRTNYFTPEVCLIIGAATFVSPAPLTSDSTREQAITVEFPDWNGPLSCGLPRDAQGRLRAQNFDQLADCPILLGDLSTHSFQAGGRPHYLVQAGDREFWQLDKSLPDVQKLVETTQEFWGDVPYSDYSFMNLITDTRGGLEHRNSTVVMTNRFATRDRDMYLGWLSLLSHEFFHTWNVKRLKPRSLSEFDYEKENYTRSLWIAEGITSYYDDLLVRRAGLSTRDEYLKALGRQLNRLQTTPGRKAITLTAASFDSWIRLYQDTDDLHNSNISYYNKGAVVAWLLDTEIRRLTNNRKNLDHVMRAAYRRFRDEGFEERAFRALASQTVGVDLEPFFVRTLDSTQELPLETALEYWNLSWKPESKDSDPYLGIQVENKDSKILITRVDKDSPAYQAGFAPGDELIALADRRLPSKAPLSVLKYLEVREEPYTALTARLGKIVERKVVVTPPPHAKSKLSFSQNSGVEALWASWLGPERKGDS